MSSLALLVVARALLAAARARGAPKGIGLVVLRRRGRRRPRRAARLRGAFQSSAVAAAVSFISGGGARPGAAPGRVREVPSLKWTPRARDISIAFLKSFSLASRGDGVLHIPMHLPDAAGDVEPCSMYT